MKIDLYRIASAALLGVPYPFNFEEAIGGWNSASFRTSEGTPYLVIFQKIDNESTRIAFGQQNLKVGIWDTGITGSGDARRVLATVIHIIREYIDRNFDQQTLNNVEFSSRLFESSGGRNTRANLYSKLLDQFLPEMFPDYRLVSVEDMPENDSGERVFKLKREDPIEYV